MPLTKLQKAADAVFRNWQLSQKTKVEYLCQSFPDKPYQELEDALQKAEDDYLYNNTLYHQPPRD